MKPYSTLHEITARLDRVFEVSDGIEDDEIKSHLSRYLCVLTSGYIEESVKILTRDYVSINSSPFISNHLNSSIGNLSNINSEKLCQLLNSFSGSWRESFENVLTDSEKDAIDSVVANRHLIAHGINVGISYIRIKEWHKEIKRVVEKIKAIMK